MLSSKIAIASPSLGEHPSHTLPDKIIAAATNGFSGIEITYPDLEAHAKDISVSMLEAANQIRHLCNEKNLTVLAFASFQNFEGNKTPLDKRLQTATIWLDLARALGAEHLQIPSIYLRDINNDHDLMVTELRQLTDLAASAEPVVKVAYENLGWATHVVLWQDALRMVEEVDRPNFGLCLDSFHLSVALWGDAFTASGIQPNGDENLAESLRLFVRDCPIKRIFYVQLSDGERIDPPYSETHPWYDPTLEPGHVWSNEARPFPLEKEYGAYMPVLEITRAFLVEKGFEGWVSLETFDRRMREEGNGPERNARRGMKAWRNLKRALVDGKL